MKIQASNLNNSIRFYNLLLGHRPEQIGYDQATYLMDKGNLIIEERPEYIPTTSSRYQLVVVDLMTAFKRLKSTIISGSNTNCEILKDSFQVEDPDGFLWVISEGDFEPPVEKKACYLEPINF